LSPIDRYLSCDFPAKTTKPARIDARDRLCAAFGLDQPKTVAHRNFMRNS
jgi:hypothetical protein